MEEALQAYEKAHARGLSSPSLESDLGDLELDLGNAEKAEEAYRRALQKKPADVRALLGLGLSAYRRGKNDAALEAFQQARQEAPQTELIRYELEAMKGLQGTGSDLVRWFHTPDKGASFCVPAGWATYELDDEKGVYQVLFTQGPLELPSTDFETGLLYIRYDTASQRLARVSGRPKPEEVAQAFLEQAFEHLSDPLKVAFIPSSIGRRGNDRYLTGGYAHTEGERRRIVRTLSYYQPQRDRLHVITVRSTGAGQEEWAPYAQACFDTAWFE